jgi:hypothetical protein
MLFNEEMMLKLNEFSHNHHPSWVKMLAKNIRRGIRVKASLASGCHGPITSVFREPDIRYIQ